MGEYNSEEFDEEQNDKETEFNEKEDMNELDLENEFDPLDEDLDFDKDLGDTFESGDELRSNDEQFEVKFTPKDEKDAKKASIQENTKKKEVNLKEKVHSLKDKRIKSDENDRFENQLKNLSLKEYIQEHDKKDLEFKENPSGKLKESKALAEKICIGLGDGCIPHYGRRFRVTLNRSQESQYALYVYELMKKTLNKRPGIYEPKDADAIKFTISRKKIIEGLVDTDGSIHIHKHNKTLHISFNIFKNYTKIL